MTTQGTHWDGCWKEHQVCAWAEIDRLRDERNNWMQHADDAESLTAAADTIRELRSERDDFYSDYRMKCDKETKALTVERDALAARSTELERQRNSLQESLERENKMVIKFGKRYEKAEAERDALAAENLTLRNAAVSATEERDAYREKFNAQCYQADEQTLQRSQTDRDNAALRALLDRVLSCTDLRGWNGAKAELLCDEIDAVLKDKP